MVDRIEHSFVGIPALASLTNPDGAEILQTVGAPSIVANAVMTLDDVAAAVKEEYARATLLYSDRNTESTPPLITDMEHILAVVRKHEVLVEYCRQKSDRCNVKPRVADACVKDEPKVVSADAIVANIIEPAVENLKVTEIINTATAIVMDTVTAEDTTTLFETKDGSDLAKTIERAMEKVVGPLDKLSNKVDSLGGDINSMNDVLKEIRDYLTELMEVMRVLQRDVNMIRDNVVRRRRFPLF